MRKFFRFLLLTAAMLLSLAGYNAWIEVETVEAASSALPRSFDGYRVLLITDLHGRSFSEGNKRLLRAVRKAQPDLIALGGDLLDEKAQIAPVAEFMQELTAIAPCCYVTGNHEWAAGCVNDLCAAMKEAGVLVLDDDYVLLERGDAGIILAGFCDPNGYTNAKTKGEMLEEIKEKEKNPYILLLNHRNEPPETYAVQTVLSGHGHGGVVRLPLLGGLIGTDRSLFPKYTSGLYTAGETNLVVSRGLGGSRILCRPHLPLVILRKK